MWITTPIYGQADQDVQVANDYFLRGEKEKALDMYRSLTKNAMAAPAIYNNYFNLLIEQSKYKEAEDLVERMMRRDPNNLTYRIDQGMVYVKQGDLAKADKYIKSLIKASLDEPYRMRNIGDYLVSHGLTEFAEYGYKLSREHHNNQTLFTLELANLYRMQGKKDQMVAEYLNYVVQTPGNTGYVKSLMQVLLTKPEEFEILERLLIEKVQQYPDMEIYADLLIWTNLQQKNFYGAFVQARAFDKRYRKPNTKTFEIGQVALNNGDYDNAARSFSFVVREFPNAEEVLPARLGLIRASEAKIKKRYPVNLDSVRLLTQEYQTFIQRYPDNPNAYEATVSRAQLFATYLSLKDSAISQLERLINQPRAATQLKARARLELGDIYLLKNQAWESTLLYAQVEKMQKDAPLGYEAKLRNARLSYYRGDFKLAQQHLDILKEATSREIANDAMDLSIRIKENATFDTLALPLKEFAFIELLLYQNKTKEAMIRLEHFGQKKSIRISAKEAEEREYNISPKAGADSVDIEVPAFDQTPTILDDVYWLQAKILIRMGKPMQANTVLQRILDEFPEDVLADDAYFTQAELQEQQSTGKGKAMEMYREFLNRFPGSVYAAEARKRYRNLRGDFVDISN